jgi:hypothetical protein
MTTIQQQSARNAEDPQLRQYLEEIEAIRLDARTVAADLTPAQLNWKADAKRWSIAQCLQHVTLTLRLYPEKVERMIAESRQRLERGERPFREGWFTRWFVRSMEPPPRLRVRTMNRVEPPRLLNRDAVLQEFDEAHVRLAELVRQADGVSLVHARTASPFLSLLHFTLGQTIAMNLAHSRRHLWQARQVRAAAGFPR